MKKVTFDPPPSCNIENGPKCSLTDISVTRHFFLSIFMIPGPVKNSGNGDQHPGPRIHFKKPGKVISSWIMCTQVRELREAVKNVFLPDMST